MKFLILLLLALIASSCGFKKYVYFIGSITFSVCLMVTGYVRHP